MISNSMGPQMPASNAANEFFCEICSKNCNNHANFSNHLSGKKHAEAVGLAKNQGRAIPARLEIPADRSAGFCRDRDNIYKNLESIHTRRLEMEDYQEFLKQEALSKKLQTNIKQDRIAASIEKFVKKPENSSKKSDTATTTTRKKSTNVAGYGYGFSARPIKPPSTQKFTKAQSNLFSVPPPTSNLVQAYSGVIPQTCASSGTNLPSPVADTTYFSTSSSSATSQEVTQSQQQPGTDYDYEQKWAEYVKQWQDYYAATGQYNAPAKSTPPNPIGSVSQSLPTQFLHHQQQWHQQRQPTPSLYPTPLTTTSSQQQQFPYAPTTGTDVPPQNTSSSLFKPPGSVVSMAVPTRPSPVSTVPTMYPPTNTVPAPPSSLTGYVSQKSALDPFPMIASQAQVTVALTSTFSSATTAPVSAKPKRSESSWQDTVRNSAESILDQLHGHPEQSEQFRHFLQQMNINLSSAKPTAALPKTRAAASTTSSTSPDLAAGLSLDNVQELMKTLQNISKPADSGLTSAMTTMMSMMMTMMSTMMQMHAQNVVLQPADTLKKPAADTPPPIAKLADRDERTLLTGDVSSFPVPRPDIHQSIVQKIPPPPREKRKTGSRPIPISMGAALETLARNNAASSSTVSVKHVPATSPGLFDAYSLQYDMPSSPPQPEIVRERLPRSYRRPSPETSCRIPSLLDIVVEPPPAITPSEEKKHGTDAKSDTDFLSEETTDWSKQDKQSRDMLLRGVESGQLTKPILRRLKDQLVTLLKFHTDGFPFSKFNYFFCKKFGMVFNGSEYGVEKGPEVLFWFPKSIDYFSRPGFVKLAETYDTEMRRKLKQEMLLILRRFPDGKAVAGKFWSSYAKEYKGGLCKSALGVKKSLNEVFSWFPEDFKFDKASNTVSLVDSKLAESLRPSLPKEEFGIPQDDALKRRAEKSDSLPVPVPKRSKNEALPPIEPIVKKVLGKYDKKSPVQKKTALPPPPPANLAKSKQSVGFPKSLRIDFSATEDEFTLLLDLLPIVSDMLQNLPEQMLACLNIDKQLVLVTIQQLMLERKRETLNSTLAGEEGKRLITFLAMQANSGYYPDLERAMVDFSLLAGLNPSDLWIVLSNKTDKDDR